jgi:hypothetical protein
MSVTTFEKSRLLPAPIKKATKQFLNNTRQAMGTQPERDYSKILEFYNIKPTEVRIAVLKAIYSAWVEFDVNEIVNLLESGEQKMNRNSVMSILRLYRSRELLVRVQKTDQRDKAGRPVVKFLLNGKHILTIL